MKNTETGGKEAEGLVTAALNIQEQPDSSWLDIDQLLTLIWRPRTVQLMANAKIGNIKDQPGPDGAKDSQAGDGSQDMHHNIDGAEDGPGDGDGVMDGGEDVIADPEMEGLEVDGGDSMARTVAGLALASMRKVGDNRVSFFGSELTLQFQESRTRPTPKLSKL